MAAGNSRFDILINIGMNGLRRLLVGFNRIQSAARRVGSAMRRDMQRLAAVSGAAARALGAISKAALGLGAASIAAFVAALAKAKDIAGDVAEKLELINTRAKGAKIDDKIRFEGLFFAAEQAGIEDAETVIGALAGMQAAVRDLKDGSEDMRDAFAALGGEYKDFFDADGNILAGDELFKNLSRLIDDLPDDKNIAEALLPILGETDAFEFARFFELGSDEIEKNILLYKELADVREDDFKLAREYKQSLTSLNTAKDGLQIAFARGLFPDLSKSTNDFTLFYNSVKPQMEELGRRFGEIFRDITPKAIEAGNILANLLAGNGAALEDTPLKRALTGIGKVIKAVSSGMSDVLDYLSGGTPAPWLEATIGVFTGIASAARDFASTYTETVKPAFESMGNWLDNFYSMFGVEGKSTQFALTAGLIAFSGTITTLIGTLGRLAAQFTAIAGPLLSIAGSIAALTGGTAFSVADVKRQFEEAERHAAELGGDAGAAYYLAFLKEVPEQYKLFQGFNEVLQYAGRGVDIDGAIADLEEQLASADPIQIQLGTDSLKEDIADKGYFDIQSSGSRFVEGAFDNAEKAWGLTSVNFNLFSKATELLSGSIDKLVDGLSVPSAPPIPSLPGATTLSAAPKEPAIIQLGNLGYPVEGSPDVISSLVDAARKSNRARL